MSVPHLVRTLGLGLVLWIPASASAQGTFTINGRVKVDGGSLDGTRVVVMKDGQKDRTLSSNLARFSLDLEIGHSYILSFEKDGFVTKKLSFDTHAPAEAVEQGFTPFEFAVSLFKQYDDVNMVIFNQPVGMIRYDANAGDFDYDTDYTKSIQSQLQKVQEQVAEKQKQEQASTALQEKEKAKAEEEARKAATERAAAEAKAKKDAEVAAAKAEADRKKQEAQSARAEQDRVASEARKAAEEKKAQEAAARAEADRKAAEARRMEEEQRKAALAKKAEEKPPPPPPPPPVVKKEEPRKPPPPPPQRNTVRAGAKDGEDGRRTVQPREGVEESPMKMAEARSSEEERPDASPIDPEYARDEELIIEKNQVITVIRLATDREKAEYRKVVHKYGATFYFKNGEAISKEVYEHEALAETH